MNRNRRDGRLSAQDRPDSIRRNYFYNTLYQILTMITPLITAPYVSRVLGSAGVGIYSYTNSVAAYFTVFAALGTASYGQREIAMHRDSREECSRLFWEIEILSAVTTGTALLAWAVWIATSSRYTAYYGILTLTLAATAFDISWFYSGLERFRHIVLRNTLVKLAGIALLFLFVRTRNDVGIYIAITASTGLLGNISMWTYLPRFVQRTEIRSIHPFRHLRQTIAYFIPTIATSVYTVLDKTMIGAFTRSAEQNGYYEQATKIVRMIQALLFSLNTVMGSRQSYLFAEGRLDEIRDKIRKSLDFLSGLAIAAMFGLQGIAANFVPWFFGAGYEPVIGLLELLAPLPLVICVSNVLGNQYLTPSGQIVRSTRGILAGAVINFALNFVLIPRYAGIGAAAASLAAECVISILYMRMSRGFASWGYLLKIFWKKLIAGAAMLGILVLLGHDRSGSIVLTFLQIAAGAMIYCIVLWILKDSFMELILQMIREKIHG